ncbi:MAG: glycosyltransferase [Candidatus Omnitrophota bacterium]
MPDPILSVVIVSRNAEKTIRKCLDSLMGQLDPESAEIILVDSSTDNTPKIVEKEFPLVRLFHFTERKFPGEARNFGNAQAKGGIIACIDSDCIAGEGWIDAILKAHQTSYVAIGGPVKNGNPETFFGWAAYLTWFGDVFPRGKASETRHLPTCNVSYKKWAFERCGGFLEKNYSHDTEFNWRLRKNGCKLWFSPDISVAHINSASFIEFIKYGIVRGRDFSAARAVSEKFSRFKDTVYIILFPVFPLVIAYKYVLRALGSDIPKSKLAFVFPFMLIGSLVWAIGEFLGYSHDLFRKRGV